jgi:hypothetical protein
VENRRPALCQLSIDKSLISEANHTSVMTY